MCIRSCILRVFSVSNLYNHAYVYTCLAGVKHDSVPVHRVVILSFEFKLMLIIAA